LKRHDRFVNNELLGFVSRPQYDTSCSISSLTAVYNYLYSAKIGIKTTDELVKILGYKSVDDITGVGNMTIIKWFDKLNEHFKLKGKSKFFLKGEELENWGGNSEVIKILKETIKSDKKALIYHMANHYTIIVGYFEHSEEAEDAYEEEASLQRWIVLGEHSDYNPLPDLIQKAIKVALPEDTYNLVMEKSGLGPIWTRRWKSIRHDLINTPNHCILGFSKE